MKFKKMQEKTQGNPTGSDGIRAMSTLQLKYDPARGFLKRELRILGKLRTETNSGVSIPYLLRLRNVAIKALRQKEAYHEDEKSQESN